MKWVLGVVLLAGCNRYWVGAEDWRTRGGGGRAVCATRVSDDTPTYLRAHARLWRRAPTRGDARQVVAWSKNADMALAFVVVGGVLAGTGGGLAGYSATHPDPPTAPVSPLIISGLFVGGLGAAFLLPGIVLGGIALGTRDHEAAEGVAGQVCGQARR